MEEITLLANAKVNLSLDITGVRESDGYHLMDMINCSMSLSDEVTLRRGAAPGIALRSEAKYVPADGRNLAVRAAEALSRTLGQALPPLEIDIKKRIPTQAGLAGGSADAAAVLVGLRALLGLELSDTELCAVGETIGADVPFCVVGGLARVTGIGEILQPLPCPKPLAAVLLMPRRGRSTKEAFAAFDRGTRFAHPHTDALAAALAAGDIPGAAMLLRNAFSSMNKTPTTEKLETLLLQNGALGASMTGSGAAVFGLFPDKLTAQKCRDRLRGHEFSAYTADSCPSGVSVLRAV